MSVGSVKTGEVGSKSRKEGKTRHLLNAFVLLLLGFEALTGGDDCLEVWTMGLSDQFEVLRKRMYLSEAFDRHPRAPEASFGLLPSRVGCSEHSRHCQDLDNCRADGGVIK